MRTKQGRSHDDLPKLTVTGEVTVSQTDERRRVRRGDIIWLKAKPGVDGQVGREAIEAWHIHLVGGVWNVDLVGHASFPPSLLPRAGVIAEAAQDGCESRWLSVRLPG